MTVNNNFHGSKIVPTQTFVESGSKSKEPGSPNIQMMSPEMSRPQQFPKQSEQNNEGKFLNHPDKNLPNPYQQFPFGRILNNLKV